MVNKKTEIITFKVDGSLLRAIGSIPNRSEFIRNAILNALDSVCPLCGGSGIMTPNQKSHWDVFTANHSIVECDDCHERYLTCSTESKKH
jgi:hypothetical protein